MADVTTLIPKTGQDRYAQRHEPMGIFMVFGVLTLVISTLILGGVIFYKQSVEKQIELTQQESRRLEAEFSESSVKDWARMAESINIAKEVLDQHKYISNTFSFFEKNVLPEVRFSKYDYDSTMTKVAVIGSARSFTALAQQKAIFDADPSIKNIGIGNFNLTANGGIDFSMDLTFNGPVLLSNE